MKNIAQKLLELLLLEVHNLRRVREVLRAEGLRRVERRLCACGVKGGRFRIVYNHGDEQNCLARPSLSGNDSTIVLAPGTSEHPFLGEGMFGFASGKMESRSIFL